MSKAIPTIESILTTKSMDHQYDFREGVMILVDKPLEWTSFDVVNKIRGKLRFHLNDKKIKVGHAGTLDPLASGLLIVCTGKYTKCLDHIQAKSKRYLATIALGGTTPTYDRESEIEQHFSIDHLTEPMVRTVISSFVGKQEQLPPMFSAIKINGQTLHKLARKGKEVKREPRPIEIHDIDIHKVELPQVKIEVECSKGTYIRSLAYDIGQKLNAGGYLYDLRRLTVGAYNVADAIPILDIANWLDDRLASR